MDPITAAMVAALSAGAVSGLTEASKTSITDAYNKLKDLLTKKFGVKSNVVQALDQLEAKPESAGRKETLQEEMTAVNAERDDELLAAARHVLTLLHSQQAGLGKFTIQNNAPVQGQTVGDYNTIIHVVEDQQPPLVCLQPLLDGSHHLHLVGVVLLGKLELTGETHQVGNQRFEVFCSDPEDKRIGLPIAVGIFNGDLCFAYPTQATNRLDLG